MSERVHVPGGRRVVATLDRPDAARVVVACPPHPRHGGSRSDRRLRAVSDALAPDVACLRFDYGASETRSTGANRSGRAAAAGSRVDAENALRWAADRFDGVGLFGYSFGAGVALRAAESVGPESGPAALSVLAPPGEDAAVAALDAVDRPVQVVYGERDDTVDWRPVVERARERGHAVESLPADHHFLGQDDRVGGLVAPFLRERV